MNFAQRLSPAYIPPAVLLKGGLQLHREKILQAMLLIFIIMGPPAVIFRILSAVQDGRNQALFIYPFIYLLLVALTVSRNIPYPVRAFPLIAVAYLLAVSNLFDGAGFDEVRMTLVIFVALTAVLFSYRHLIASLIIGFLTIAAAGIYAGIPQLPFLPSMENLNQGTSWLISGMVFLMVGSMLGGSISMLISGLETSLKNADLLAHNLAKERDELDAHVKDRTQSMVRQLAHLQTASEISRAISVLTDRDALLKKVTDIVKDRLDLYYVGIFLLDKYGENAVLQAGTGLAGEKMVQNGHQLAVGGSSMIGWASANRQARIALDVGSEAVRFNNPLLPLTRSELALPIIAHNDLLGAITVQSEQPNAFNENDIDVLESIADSLAIALENVSLYQETRDSLEEIRLLNRGYYQQAWREASQIHGELESSYAMSESESPEPNPSQSITIPLTLRGEEIGQVQLDIDRPALTEEEITYITNITTQTAIALENARLLEDIRMRGERERLVGEITNKVRAGADVDSILRIATQEIGKSLGLSEVVVQLFKED